MSEVSTRNGKGTSPQAAARGLRYFSIFLFVVALLCCVALAFTSFDAVRMAFFGADGQATVVNLRTHTYRTVKTYGGGSGSVVNTSLRTDYYVTYTFEVDGQVYRRERPVSEALYDGLTEGKKTAVRYLPWDAEENHIDREWVAWSVIGPAIMAIVFFCAGYLFYWAAKKAAEPQPKPADQFQNKGQ
jgi:hypothetical protein